MLKKHTPLIVVSAAEFAVDRHGDQMYGVKPYIYHLRAVVSTVQAYHVWDKHILAACYLHDVLEDTATTKEELVREFGPYIADMVDACTDGTGKNRNERKKRPYGLIPRVPGAVTVKVADRLANVIANRVEGNAHLSKMYQEEHFLFCDHLRSCVPADDTATLAMFATLDLQLRDA